jgi:hypothetical protein
MSRAWLGIAVVAATLAAAAVRLRLLLRGPRARERAVIRDLEDRTFIDERTGAVRSVQCAELLVDRGALEEVWSPMHLERLARTYWRFLSRVTLGLVRVRYSPQERSVVLLVPPLRLLRFDAPEYEIDGGRGLVRWRIASGLLVSRRGRDGRGYLQIEVRRSAGANDEIERLRVEVEVANFYPSIASRLSRRVYNGTQSRIHVIVTCGFLRSLARLELEESRVGRFSL